MTRFWTLLSSATLVASIAIPTGASTIDKKTTFTFNHPVTLPGVTLPAGTYVFRLADPDTGSAIEITDARGRESYAIVLAKPVARMTDDNKGAALRFMNSAAGPTAVDAWWSEGDKMGYQLIYPKHQQEALLTQGTPTQPEIALAANNMPAPRGPRQEGQLAQAQTPAPAPRPAAAQDPAPRPAPAARTPEQPSDSAARETLPRTAGFLPFALIGAVGAIAAGAWMSLRSAKTVR